MPMTEPQCKQMAIELLRTFGVTARAVPETTHRTPDLRGSDGVANYAIELKQRDGDRYLDELVQSMAVGQVGSLAPLGLDRENNTQTAIDYAVSQLRNEADDTLRILWIDCEGFDAQSDCDRTIASLLGTGTLLDRSCVGDGDGDGHVHRCHFYGHNDFWKHRAVLDGGIVTRDKGNETAEMFFLINPYSPRATAVRACSIATNLSGDGVWDVPAMEASRECLWVNAAINRDDAAAVLAHLNAKYRMDLTPVPIRRYGGAVRAR